MGKKTTIAVIITLFLTIFFWQSCIVCLNCDKVEELIGYAYVYVSETDTSELFHFPRALEIYSQDERTHLDSVLFYNVESYSNWNKEPIHSFLWIHGNNPINLDPLDSLYNSGLYNEVLSIDIR